jgi:sulfite oxidase
MAGTHEFRPHLTQEPFNAEPARRDLAASYITPVDLFFKRNHGPIPILDDIDRFRCMIARAGR